LELTIILPHGRICLLKVSPERRRWSWYVSSLFYRFSYVAIAHQLDEDLFAYLGSRISGAVVADCGCGPGIVTEKFLRQGAGRVFAIDANSAMLNQMRSRLADALASGRVVDVHRAFDPGLFSDLSKRFLGGGGFDIILFKRSLYSEPQKALPVLRAAVEALNPRGILAVIHAERSLKRYAFGPGLKIMSYTPYHLFDRAVSRLGEKLGIGRYTLYTQAELLDLLRAAACGRRVESIPSQQQAYNLLAVLN
jgi:SAM-dependent methyltransferase